VILLVVLALFMIAGGIPIEGDAQLVVFRTPMFVVLLDALCVLLVLGCARYGRRPARAVFLPAHLGVLLVLAGTAMSALLGADGHLSLPVGGWHAANRLPVAADSAAVELGFRLSVTDFEVSYYESPRDRSVPKDFEATLSIVEDGNESIRMLKVNKPVTVAGWRIYLMSYEMHPSPYVRLLLRRDPGRITVLVGIWLIIVGTALLCWRRESGRTRHGEQVTEREEL